MSENLRCSDCFFESCKAGECACRCHREPPRPLPRDTRCFYCRHGEHAQCQQAKARGTQFADVLACECTQYHQPIKEAAK